MTKAPTPPGAKLHDGFVVDGELIQIPGVECVSYVRNPRYAAKIGRHGRKRTPKETPRFGVCHNDIGSYPVTVLKGKGPRGKGDRVARYLARTDRYAGVHVVFEPDGLAICQQDIERVAAYGAGHSRANALGVQFELAALKNPNGGVFVYEDQVMAAALFLEWCATRWGWERVCSSPRPRNKCLVRAVARRGSTINVTGDHSIWTRARDLGDTGFVVCLVLVQRFGWRFVDYDLAA